MSKSRQVRDFLCLKYLRLCESRTNIGLSTAIKAGYEMTVFRVSGVNKATGSYEIANVLASDKSMAFKMMGMTHVRVAICAVMGAAK